MAGPGICILYLTNTCTFQVHPVFNPVAPYGYLLSDMYLFMADITNPDFFVKVVGPGLVSSSPAFVSSSASHPLAGMPKNGKSPFLGAGRFDNKYLNLVLHQKFIIIDQFQFFLFSQKYMND